MQQPHTVLSVSLLLGCITAVVITTRHWTTLKRWVTGVVTGSFGYSYTVHTSVYKLYEPAVQENIWTEEGRGNGGMEEIA